MVVAATGFFDGVHKGHKKVLSLLCDIAAQEGKKSAVITFWPHPRNVLQQQAYSLRLLTSIEEKKQLVKGLGVNKFITIPFCKEFSRNTTREFLKDYLKDKYGVSTLIIGYDHRFGCDKVSHEEMIAMAKEIGIRVVEVSEFIQDDNVISSTKIRNLLQEGKIERANDFLGYRYGLKGVVVSGQKVGRTIGFPTANIYPKDDMVLPKFGVYVAKATVDKEGSYDAIVNVGMKPTVEHSRLSVEAHIKGIDEELYGRYVSLSFDKFIRAERKFSSVEELKEQIKEDAKEMLKCSGTQKGSKL